MAESRGGPVLARKRLATALKTRRDAAGKTLEEVAGELLISVSKLSRLEKGQGLPQLRDVRDLINLYGLGGTDAAEDLMRWAREGRRKGWWEEYSQVLTPEQDLYIAFENEATVDLAYCIPFMHGLLQTEGYIRALISTFRLVQEPDDVEALVEARLKRNEAISSRGDQPPLQLDVILHEACLTQPMGSVEVMNEQFEHLLELSRRSNVDIRVVESRAGSHRAMFGMWQHFSFGEDIDRDVVFLESPSGFTQLEDERKTRLYSRWFDEIRRRSLSSEDTRVKIQEFLSSAPEKERVQSE